MIMAKKILYHTEIYCFYGLVPRRYYLIQKFIVFIVLSKEDIISYRKVYILIVFMGMSKKILSHAENYKYT
jgi:hypothetical protein